MWSLNADHARHSASIRVNCQRRSGSSPQVRAARYWRTSNRETSRMPILCKDSRKSASRGSCGSAWRNFSAHCLQTQWVSSRKKSSKWITAAPESMAAEIVNRLVTGAMVKGVVCDDAFAKFLQPQAVSGPWPVHVFVLPDPEGVAGKHYAANVRQADVTIRGIIVFAPRPVVAKQAAGDRE